MQKRPQTVVVITGSSRGIGLGLAAAFLQQGCCVLLSGRQPEALQQAMQDLQVRFGGDCVQAHVCDVTQMASLQALWQAALQHWGRVDVWINNAGTCNPAQPLTQLSEDTIRTVIQTNLQGAMLGSRVALEGMLQQGHGQIFNMEGWGSRGEWSPGLTPYTVSKAGITALHRGLAGEARGSGVQIGTLSPGMVATDLLIESWCSGDPQHWRRQRGLFKYVIDPVEPVSAYLARRVLTNRRAVVRIAWMTVWRLLPRFFNPVYWRRNPVAGTPLDRL